MEYCIHENSVNIYDGSDTYSPHSWYIDGIFGIGLRDRIRGYFLRIKLIRFFFANRVQKVTDAFFCFQSKHFQWISTM